MKKEKEKAEIESAFRGSKKVLRSPEQGVKMVGKEGTEKSTGGMGQRGNERKMKECFSELKREFRESMREVKEEFREIVKGQEDRTREQLEEMRKDLWKRERRCEEERRKIKEKIEELERDLKQKEKGEGERQVLEEDLRKDKGGIGGGSREMKEKMKMLERRWELVERDKRKRNVIVKGVKEAKEEEGGVRKTIEQIIKGLGVEVTVGEMRKLEAGRMEWGDMVLVELGCEKERRRVSENSRGEDVWIEKDLTWRERRGRWMMKQVARREMSKGRGSVVGLG